MPTPPEGRVRYGVSQCGCCGTLAFVSISPIFTTEPMLTRALAAEIRQAPGAFTRLLQDRLGIDHLGHLEAVRCEASERLDLELTFTGSKIKTVGIEAKVDHELTRNQVDRQIAVVDRLIVLLAEPDSAPGWLKEYEHVSVVTWPDALTPFQDSRLTSADIEGMPLVKSTIERRFRAARVEERLPQGWRVEIARGGSGMPAIEIESPELPNGRTLRGQVQVSGRGMPTAGATVFLEYSIGVAVYATSEDYPDPDLPHEVPGWIESLTSLKSGVLEGNLDRLLVSTHRPGNGRSLLGKRKLPLAVRHLGDATWLVKGYTDGWALGVKSIKQPIEDLDAVISATSEIFTKWFDIEKERQRLGH